MGYGARSAEPWNATCCDWKQGVARWSRTPKKGLPHAENPCIRPVERHPQADPSCWARAWVLPILGSALACGCSDAVASPAATLSWAVGMYVRAVRAAKSPCLLERRTSSPYTTLKHQLRQTDRQLTSLHRRRRQTAFCASPTRASPRSSATLVGADDQAGHRVGADRFAGNRAWAG
jgi:hypothetical protein